MEYHEFEGPYGAAIRVPKDEIHRTCPACGGDCEPEPTSVSGLGVRIAFTCPEHGVHSVIDPFEGQR